MELDCMEKRLEYVSSFNCASFVVQGLAFAFGLSPVWGWVAGGLALVAFVLGLINLYQTIKRSDKKVKRIIKVVIGLIFSIALSYICYARFGF